jgi:hypothetical protein
MTTKIKCTLCSGSGNSLYMDPITCMLLLCPRCGGSGKISPTYIFDRDIKYLRREVKQCLLRVSKLEKRIKKIQEQKAKFLKKGKKKNEKTYTPCVCP